MTPMNRSINKLIEDINSWLRSYEEGLMETYNEYKRVVNSGLPSYARSYSYVKICDESALNKLKHIDEILNEIKSIDSNVWKEIQPQVSQTIRMLSDKWNKYK